MTYKILLFSALRHCSAGPVIGNFVSAVGITSALRQTTSAPVLVRSGSTFACAGKHILIEE
jgi:hypothetical protein